MLMAKRLTSDRDARLAPVIFTATIFLSASLLFFVQPLFAKIVLPHVGGSPAVWTAAMLFFQTALIGGYLYAHLLTRYLPLRAQVGVHLALWAVALLTLPPALPEGWQLDTGGWVVWQTLGLFAAGVGLPFFALAANAPLLQFWYSRSGGPMAHDPYFLYRASNLGSLIALLGFPLMAEPLFGAQAIGLGWAAGFVCLGAGLAASGLATRGAAAMTMPRQDRRENAAPRWRDVAGWGFMAFIPSSLMLAVTLKISIDMGAFPLVWAVPLALYLLSFVAAFASRDLLPPSLLTAGGLIALGILLFYTAGLHGNYLTWPDVALLLIAFFLIAVFAHRRLYRARPAGRHLTGFYLAMSVGGALGGLFNSVLAPALFDRVLELGITLGLAGMLFIPLTGEMRRTLYEGIRGILVGGMVSVPAYLTGQSLSGGDWGAVLVILLVGWSISMAFLRRSAAGAYTATIMLALTAVLHMPDGALLRERSFFGLHMVSEAKGMRLYGNGTTVHGAQRLADDTGPGRPEPLYYYHPNGPLAEVFASAAGEEAQNVGIVGLGVGALSCYRRAGQDWEFYEIDPVVDRIARSPELFRFMSDCAPDAPTHLGDARMVLERQAGKRYDILVIDAYSSDAVPVHLTTHEAMQLYLDRLTPEGVLVYHISNRYYDISRPLARSAEALGLAARLKDYTGNERTDPGDVPTTATVFARHPARLEAFEREAGWQVLESDGERIWTDDFANLLSIIRR
ncbi:MAG: fused MFS/spermidine synthase [Roseovarius sp.]